MFQPIQYAPPDFSAPNFISAPDVKISPAPLDGVAPEGYHAMSIYPEYFKLRGVWTLAGESRMDCVAVVRDDAVEVTEFRRLRKGDMVVLGRSENGEDGIYLHSKGFGGGDTSAETFAFRSGRSRETAFSKDYDELAELLRYERQHGKIVWVMGPAFAFDASARRAMSRLIQGGYVHAMLAGNALATHDLEAAYLGTALGQDVYTQKPHHNGHYNHLDTINAVRSQGGISAFIKNSGIDNGVMYSLEECGVPYVLGGSIRDDGPLPEVYGDVYKAQDAMRQEIRGATTVICLATMLHSIAVGNMTPSFRLTQTGNIRPVYFYCVDISEFVVNKLSDRGSLCVRGVVTNVQDFAVKLAGMLMD